MRTPELQEIVVAEDLCAFIRKVTDDRVLDGYSDGVEDPAGQEGNNVEMANEAVHTAPRRRGRRIVQIHRPVSRVVINTRGSGVGAVGRT